MIEYNYCSKCGRHLEKKLELPFCSKCEITYWRNAKPCASVLPIKDGMVLLAIRANEPHKGSFDIIGGFMEANELPEVAALREAREETGLEMKIISLLGFYNDEYGAGGDRTLNIHYIAEVIGGKERAMDDVAELRWVEIDKAPLNDGFKNTQDGLRDLQKWYMRH